MKGTFDKEQIKFEVIFGRFYNNDKKLNFDDVYGLGPENKDDEFISLIASVVNQDTNKEISKVNFSRIDTEESLTYEDAIRDYISINYLDFNKLEMNIALCFLERYCMDYEQVKEYIDEYKRKRKIRH